MFLKRPGIFLKRIGFFMPFTWYFVLFSAILYLGYNYLQIRSELPESAYRDIFTLLLKVILVFSLAILLFGLLTVAVSLLYVKIKQRQGEFSVFIKAGQKESEATIQKVQVRISPVLKPLMGFIKLRINYDGDRYSNKFSLVSFSSNKIFDRNINGEYEWELPEIREYKVEKILLYFEDMFQFFSFTLPLNAANRFYTVASAKEISRLNASPRKTEEISTRIDELKKVEGELLNYKNFESNDDVRRIVWKIYAKNKELVVRIPEIVDPYASHVYLYTSFYAGIDISFNELTNVPLLNFYKTMCWSVYCQLQSGGLEVRFKTDTETPADNSLASEDEIVRYAISAAGWHKNMPMKEFVKIKDASVVIVSSFSDVEEVRGILEQGGNELSVVFVPLSEAFERAGSLSWIRWLFVQEEKDSASRFRSKWNLSLQRPLILQNEKNLMRLLKQYQKSVIAYINN